MEWLNYHHLLYFWTVVREGSVSAASRRLRLAQPTVSAQLKQLELALGEKLLERSGRSLQLTEVGRVVFRYAEEIFSLGRELQDALKGRPTGRPQRLAVGIGDSLPKLIVYRILEPVMRAPAPVVLVCREEAPSRLMAALAVHEVDVVLSDSPAPAASVRVYSHLLGECGVTFFAAGDRAEALGRRFPASLDGEPFLMPGEGTALRRSLEQWLEAKGVRPFAAAEFQDSALMGVFGQAGAGVFAAPSAVADEVESQYSVRRIGAAPDIRERFYLLSTQRRLKDPAIVSLTQAARSELFTPGAR